LHWWCNVLNKTKYSNVQVNISFSLYIHRISFLAATSTAVSLKFRIYIIAGIYSIVFRYLYFVKRKEADPLISCSTIKMMSFRNVLNKTKYSNVQANISFSLYIHRISFLEEKDWIHTFYNTSLFQFNTILSNFRQNINYAIIFTFNMIYNQHYIISANSLSKIRHVFIQVFTFDLRLICSRYLYTFSGKF
jgi:hypothetical protein